MGADGGQGLGPNRHETTLERMSARAQRTVDGRPGLLALRHTPWWPRVLPRSLGAALADLPARLVVVAVPSMTVLATSSTASRRRRACRRSATKARSARSPPSAPRASPWPARPGTCSTGPPATARTACGIGCRRDGSGGRARRRRRVPEPPRSRDGVRGRGTGPGQRRYEHVERAQQLAAAAHRDREGRHDVVPERPFGEVGPAGGRVGDPDGDRRDGTAGVVTLPTGPAVVLRLQQVQPQPLVPAARVRRHRPAPVEQHHPGRPRVQHPHPVIADPLRVGRRLEALAEGVRGLHRCRGRPGLPGGVPHR